MTVSPTPTTETPSSTSSSSSSLPPLNLPFNLPPQVEKVREHLEKYPILQQGQDLTGVDKFYLVSAVGALLVLFILVGYGVSLICNILGFLYPAYASFHAIESESKVDDVQWLTYWVVYACFSIIEAPSDCLLSWIPFYHIWKLVFLVWLFHPSTQGATTLYRNILHPFLAKHEFKIDSAFDSAVKNSGSVIADVTSMAADVGGEVGKLAAARYAANVATQGTETMKNK